MEHFCLPYELCCLQWEIASEHLERLPASCQCLPPEQGLSWQRIPNLEGPTRKPGHASVLSTHSDTAVPAFHRIRMFKRTFRHASVFKTHRHAVYHCLKQVQKPFRHASVFKTRVLTRACPFLKRAFSAIKDSKNKRLPLEKGIEWHRISKE